MDTDRDKTPTPTAVKVSVIIPCFNAAAFINECLDSVLANEATYPARLLEICVHDDGSTDGTYEQVRARYGGRVKLTRSPPPPLAAADADARDYGVGSARNHAVRNSATGAYLLFQDADDAAHPERVVRQVRLAASLPFPALVGADFARIPADATPRYTRYHQSLPDEHSVLEAHSFRDLPLAMPTWCCSRALYDAVGGFAPGRRQAAEDLLFFYKARALFPDTLTLRKCRGITTTGDESAKRAAPPYCVPLVTYRYRPTATSLALDRRCLLRIRVRAFEQLVLQRRPAHWRTFMLWGCGRDGKLVFRLLSEDAKQRVACFLDVHPRRIGTRVHGRAVRDVSELRAPFITCVAWHRYPQFDALLQRVTQRGGYVMGRDWFPLV